MPNQGFDADMKIVPDDITRLFEAPAPAVDDSIDLFIRQRSIGNIDKASRLGIAFVAELLDCVWTQPPKTVDTALFELQLKLLFCYSVHRVVEDHSPNSILANATLSSFYEHLEDAAPTLFAAVASNAAFTVYIYLHRGQDESNQTIGKAFAKLCQAPEDEDCIALGEGAYMRYLGGCTQKITTVDYAL